jgi:hypothetical protein
MCADHARSRTMKLTPEQREAFDRYGYLFFPGLFRAV